MTLLAIFETAEYYLVTLYYLKIMLNRKNVTHTKFQQYRFLGQNSWIPIKNEFDFSVLPRNVRETWYVKSFLLICERSEQ